MSATTIPAAASPMPTAFPADWTVAEVHAQLGGVPLERIRIHPPLGTATKEDLLEVLDHQDRICELIDGILVEKTMGYMESLISVEVAFLIRSYLQEHDLGILLGEAGTLEILPNQVRVPDVCFLSWRHFPNRQLPRAPIPALAPDLAVEVLSAGNAPGEMRRKLREYFDAGVRLVWYIDPRTRSARAYTSPEEFVEIGEGQSLSGGDVLPGFELPLDRVLGKK